LVIELNHHSALTINNFLEVTEKEKQKAKWRSNNEEFIFAFQPDPHTETDLAPNQTAGEDEKEDLKGTNK